LHEDNIIPLDDVNIMHRVQTKSPKTRKHSTELNKFKK